MKIIKYNFFLAGILSFFMLVLFSACNKKDDVVAADNLDKLITANPDLTLFNTALAKTRLNSFTQGGGPFTIIAPTNAAFAAAGINSTADFAVLDSNSLVQILTYHIQAGARSYTEFPLGPNATMTTQGGFTQYGSRYVGGSIYINGGKINGTGTAASNGYLYTIDKVLVPGFASNSITALLAANNNFKLMLQALNKTAVAITGTATVFAVPNTAMTTAGYDSTSIAALVPATPAYTALQNIMKYHVIPQRIFSPDFKTGNLKTLQGTNVVITQGQPVQVKGTSNITAFTITFADINAANGIIHFISGLLKP